MQKFEAEFQKRAELEKFSKFRQLSSKKVLTHENARHWAKNLIIFFGGGVLIFEKKLY